MTDAKFIFKLGMLAGISLCVGADICLKKLNKWTEEHA